MLLPQYSIFGDYQIICDVKSNIIFKTAKYSQQTRFMCVSRKVLQNLCDLFPVTADNLKIRGLQKRLHYLKAMLRLDNLGNTKYKALQRSQNKPTQEEMALVKNLLKDSSTDSMLNKEGIDALELAAANVEKFAMDGSDTRGRLLTDDPGP